MSSSFTNQLTITICNSSADAVDKGFVYRAPEYKPAKLSQAVVVASGMKSGKPSVDLIFTDASGQKHVTVITGQLLLKLAEVIKSQMPVQENRNVN